MNEVRVSVVIPVYNLAPFLEECVSSVCAQTVQPAEILIVDNGSTDGSQGIARSLQQERPGLIRVLHQPKRGAPAARNLGLEQATAPWIQFLDGDDLLLPEKIAHQLACISESVAVVAGPAVERDQDGAESLVPLAESVHEGLFYGGGRLGFTSSNLWSREALRSIGGWNEALRSSQEYELMFRLVRQGYRICLSTGALTVRRVHAGQISNTPYGPRLYNYLKLRHLMFFYLRDQGQLTAGQAREFVEHYMLRYGQLRRFAPRLAIRFRRDQLREAMA
ncbi:MAG: glycosyltransferase family A protein, partial [Saprospiraceae bacterium]|nr:glycosyltransferase family A protein [Saprospiraceae bacterium]